MPWIKRCTPAAAASDRRSADAALALVLAAAAWAATAVHAQLRDFVPVGVVYRSGADAARERRDLEEMRRLRFNVIARGGQPETLLFIDRLLAGAPYPGLPDPALAPAQVPTRVSPAGLTVRAWSALAHGARAIVFDDWQSLQDNPEALSAAAAFAEAVTRNAGLYANLRSDAWTLEPKVEGHSDVHAHLLRSRNALVLFAINHGEAAGPATIRFPPGVPEAIWRNLLTGVAVNFVTSARGVEYARTFAPLEVVVLVIDAKER